ncbi:MAG: hypothetical protein CMJ81_22560 [Planctomycetaceae bacterium]|nr:hypothetical protein [Planctomycetaceae bacterium]
MPLISQLPAKAIGLTKLSSGPRFPGCPSHQPAPPADKRTLIRRATFDLVGLPPTQSQVQDFLNDNSPDAFAKVVDRLLNSPRYGERWGRHWLDLARYADTHGGAPVNVVLFPFSYTYRDYVIRAFNNDLPYDQFVMEQIAADQLGLGGDARHLAALGFLTVGRRFRNPHDTIDDRIDVVTRGLMGLNVTCARCHDHKFDEIPTEDYYSLYAVFSGSREPDDLPLLGSPQETPEYQEFQRELEHLKNIRDNTLRDHNQVLQNRLRMQVGMYLRELAKETPEQDLSTIFLSFRTEDVRPTILNRWRDYLAKQTTEDDPVFGLWHRCSKLSPDDFKTRSTEIIAKMRAENGKDGQDPDKYNAPPGTAPRWNPRVLDAMSARPLSSMLDVADVYGELFTAIQQEWMQGLLDMSLQALPDAPHVADHDRRHVFLNSPVNRQLRSHLQARGTPTVISYKSARDLLNRPYRDRVEKKEIAVHEMYLQSEVSPPRAMTLTEKEAPGPQHVFLRGNPINRGAMVPSRFLGVLTEGERAVFAAGKRRLSLARAIADPANPLTSRFLVNWVWKHHFGRGLVRTPDDFGRRGELPTHPHLLDYLAANFVQNGWSLKKLQRQIMCSTAYQQSSADSEIQMRTAKSVDPDNHLLWRMPPKRLELEAMRDAMLSVAGVLDTSMGGRPVDLFAEPSIPRRSIYGFVDRDVIAPFFSTFDMADPSACTARRPETTVPQQALFALNSTFVLEQAVSLAASTGSEQPTDDSLRVRRLYHRVYARDPNPDELAIALQYIHAQSADAKLDSWTKYAQVLLAANEFMFVD